MKLPVIFLVAASALFAQTPPPHPAWSGDKVHEIRIRFAQPDYWAQLAKNYLGTEQQAIYLEGSLEWGPYKFASVGVRYKGNSSYSGARTLKKPFRIKLNEFVKGQKVEGIGAFNLSNGLNDPSLVREPLYYEMATALGLKAPRTNYAALYVNDEYIGLYILGEVVNSDFLKNYFGSKEDTGNLYKGNIGASFADLGDDKAKYKEVWEKQTNEEADDWADLIELCKIIDTTPAAQLKAKLEPLMDIDSVLTALALDNATVNLDSYVGLNQNFNIYRRPSDKRWVWIVWDPSLAFGAFGGGAASVTDLATEYTQTGGGFPGGGGGGLPPGGMPPGGLPPGGLPPGGLPPGGLPPGGLPPGGLPPGGGAASATRPLATKLWEIPEYKERYRQIYSDLVARIYNPEKLVARANAIRSMIRPYVQADTQLLNTVEQFESAMTAPLTPQLPGSQPGGLPGGGGFTGASAPGLQAVIDGRVAWLKTQFANQTFPVAKITANTAQLSFTATATQKIELNYTGVNTPPTWSLYASTENGGNWLTPNITGGPLPGVFELAINAKDLATGVYNGAVTVYMGGATAVRIPVTLTIGTIPTPAVTAIVNAASYANGAIAPGQLVTVFGTNLGVPGLKITFDGTAAQLTYTTAGQVGAVVPIAVSGKTQTSVVATYGTQTAPAVNKTVAPSAPGLFTANASGTGPGAILNQTGTLNTAVAPAPKGTIVALYLTGGGINMSTANTTVTIGGQSATLAYAGVAPGITGLNQVNATIPATAASGAQPVIVTVAGAAAQTGVTVNVQ